LTLEKRKGVTFKKTAMVPYAYAAQQTEYFGSLLDTVFAKKLDAAFAVLDSCEGMQELMKTKGMVSPQLYWNVGEFERLMKKPEGEDEDGKKAKKPRSYPGRNITPSNLARALREDPLVSKYFETIEIPFGGSSVKSVPLTKKEIDDLMTKPSVVESTTSSGDKSKRPTRKRKASSVASKTSEKATGKKKQKVTA